VFWLIFEIDSPAAIFIALEEPFCLIWLLTYLLYQNRYVTVFSFIPTTGMGLQNKGILIRDNSKRIRCISIKGCLKRLSIFGELGGDVFGYSLKGKVSQILYN